MIFLLQAILTAFLLCEIINNHLADVYNGYVV